MKIGIGNDHAGVDMKNKLSTYINNKYGYEVINFGTDTNDSCDYPVYGKKVAEAVANKDIDMGILICGTGVGIGISANKVKGVRCAICSEEKTASLCREHNDANMIAIGARIITINKAKKIIDAFLTTDFSNGERHNRRIAEMMDIEKN